MTALSQTATSVMTSVVVLVPNSVGLGLGHRLAGWLVVEQGTAVGVGSDEGLAGQVVDRSRQPLPASWIQATASEKSVPFRPARATWWAT